MTLGNKVGTFPTISQTVPKITLGNGKYPFRGFPVPNLRNLELTTIEATKAKNVMVEESLDLGPWLGYANWTT
jgi:hypothetical protein